MAEQPADAPVPETPCEVCSEPMGESWGVTTVAKNEDGDLGPIGKWLTYAPVHPACWWETHPDAVERETARHAEVRRDYVLKREEKQKAQTRGKRSA